MSKVFRLGIFRLGDENVRVLASAGYKHSQCRSSTDSKDMPILTCKLSDEWQHVVSEMTHEAMEWSMSRRDCGWDRRNACRTCGDSLIYVMNHGVLDDVACDVGHFLADVLPELAKAWKSRGNA